MPGSSWWRWSVVACFVLPALSAASGCRRGEVLNGTPLYAPFNQRKPVAVVTARIAKGRCEMAVRSLMDGRLALRIEEIALPGQAGAALAWKPSVTECVLGGRARVQLVADVPEAAPTAHGDTDVRGGAIPLDDPGRSMYREWALTRRPTERAAIDAELARLSALPPCPDP